GIQRILAGDQYMTVYKSLKRETDVAATMAIAAATGEKYQDTQTQMVSNGSVEIPSVLLEPFTVTKDNVASVIIANGMYTADQICTAEYRQACRQAGIT
ncbi:MAG TPA: sugar ABC transporter substrate-binding protein, partial [Pseudonocardiaceae bacterium]|nr:sugar ABC transporter substrate-binding protein [Pseudonocardiaceae bacterium]